MRKKHRFIIAISKVSNDHGLHPCSAIGGDRRVLKLAVHHGATLLLLLACLGCSPVDRTGRPTVQPIVYITPAPTQNVAATATTYARRSIPTATPANVYVVRPGDTLTKIADANETTIDELMTANNISDPNKIEVGQVLHLPASSATVLPSATIPITATP
ncbi:MAG: LysM peptidoglycan-binding domain-containing protein [Herpetosiphonaceae bacterium]|nr:LysM peptidoglycan-binding domain-containing protein [Herpetosiphonaceae bacterium]